jgi:glycosyltransferase involved in cell wall biosynthesis
VRILMVTQFYAPTVGGQERVVEDLSRELIARGHHVAVVALQQGGLPEISDISGVRVYRIRSTAARFFRGYADPTRPHAPPAVDPGATAELRRVLRLEKPDIVHGHDWLIYSFLPLKRRHGPGLVVTLHDQSLICANKRLIHQGRACTGPGAVKCLRCSASHYGVAKGPMIAIGNRGMATAERALVDMFLPVSQVVADAARLQEHHERHRVIPNFLPEPNGSASKENLWGLPPSFVLFAGDVGRDKGVGVLLDAHALLDDPPPLVLIGRVIDPDLLTAAVGPERVSSATLLAAPIGKVRAVGAQPHEVVLDAFRRCTVAVVPSLMHEAFGLVALEAMSAGRPVIASRIGGLSEIISDEEDGILVEPGDVEALRAALARVLAQSDVRTRLGEAARLRAAEFAADLIVPRVEQAYNDVLEARQEQPAPGRNAAMGAAGIPARIWAGLHRREERVVLALTALAIAGAALPSGAWTAVRTLLVVPLALFLPGYALTRAIFRARGPAFVERIVLALSLSLVTTALATLFLYLISVGLTLASWVATLAVVTVVATLFGAAYPSPQEDASEPGARKRARRPALRPAQMAIGLLAAGLTATAVVLALTPLPSPSAPGYTSLWLTRDRATSALTLGVRSQEHQRTRYVLRLQLSGQKTTRRLALAPGQTWQVRLPPSRRAAASLYRIGHPNVYRSVSLGASATAGR